MSSYGLANSTDHCKNEYISAKPKRGKEKYRSIDRIISNVGKECIYAENPLVYTIDNFDFFGARKQQKK